MAGVTGVVVSAGTVIAGLLTIALCLRLPRVPALLRRFSIDQWRAIDAETVRAEDGSDAGQTSLQVLMVLITVAGMLTLQEYLGGHDTYERLFPRTASTYWELRGYAWWAGWRVLGYVIIPMLVLACMPGQRILDYHISLRGVVRHLWIYAALFGAVLPMVLLASTTPAFRETYPFYRLANRSYTDLAMWEALYAAQFLSLEFFFRGFILQGLRRALGANAIFVMLVPYCMIHYGKPFPETLGAIGAGLILGTLAMRTRSIWGGVLIHVGVATTMDILALRGCPPIGGGPCH
ncbi:MAG TPA: type II CAAX endopeptidase family protein [Kofleriaceae bacterium]|jgi:membrane protease YdiL (CAAX protease family)|nr:type II CAAX endopeptidase family protein [Kofleriaceae bacterium]